MRHHRWGHQVHEVGVIGDRFMLLVGGGVHRESRAGRSIEDQRDPQLREGRSSGTARPILLREDNVCPVVRRIEVLSVPAAREFQDARSFKYDIIHGSLDVAKFIGFCNKLFSDTDGPVFLVVDGYPVYRAKAVAEYVASTHGRLRLFRLPSYSPELNRPPGHHRTRRLHGAWTPVNVVAQRKTNAKWPLTQCHVA
jgi:DDE superfamily endonuclease